jgi:hypothetical protein
MFLGTTLDKTDQSGSRIDKTDQSDKGTLKLTNQMKELQNWPIRWRDSKTDQSDWGTKNFDELGEVKLEQGIEVVESESTVSFWKFHWRRPIYGKGRYFIKFDQR